MRNKASERRAAPPRGKNAALLLLTAALLTGAQASWPQVPVEVLGDLGQLEASMHSSVLSDLREAETAVATPPAGFPDSSAVVGRVFRMHVPTKAKDSRMVKVSMMIGNQVDCTVKSPVALKIGDAVSDVFCPGVYITDVVMGEPENIQEISFKNYYTAYLTVRVLKREVGAEDSPAKWATCVRDHCLMTNPHTEGGSQDYFSIYRQQMLTEPDNVTVVRLIQRQPSSLWLGFALEEIKIYSAALEDSERDVPSWLSTITPVEEALDLNGLPDPDAVSSSIQQMWALTEVMQSSQTTASVGRFDVDGCYDINLLSYT